MFINVLIDPGEDAPKNKGEPKLSLIKATEAILLYRRL
jgi:hypothetical protein